jgi:hypothetical protein
MRSLELALRIIFRRRTPATRDLGPIEGHAKPLAQSLTRITLLIGRLVRFFPSPGMARLGLPASIVPGVELATILVKPPQLDGPFPHFPLPSRKVRRTLLGLLAHSQRSNCEKATGFTVAAARDQVRPKRQRDAPGRGPPTAGGRSMISYITSSTSRSDPRTRRGLWAAAHCRATSRAVSR